MTKTHARLLLAKLNQLIQQFLKDSPDFTGGKELAGEIGTAMADVEDAINSL